VLTDCQKGRAPGARIKHRVKNNWLTMSDKFGWVLRIETVINDPREFRVRRLRTRDGRREMIWCPMNKGVANLYRYREVALASNRRYLDALAVMDDPQPAYRQVEELTEPVVVSGRSHAGFNPARPGDVRLFWAVLAGENLPHGFRDADIREALYGTTEEVAERRRQSHAVHEVLLAHLRHAYKIDFGRFIVDTGHVRAVGGGEDTGPSPVDCSRPGRKHAIVTDAGGVGRPPAADCLVRHPEQVGDIGLGESQLTAVQSPEAERLEDFI
jgi:hypothetical protein